MTKVVNCTPHSISFVDALGNIIEEVAPSGILPRCITSRKVVGFVNGIPVNETIFDKVVNLPEPEEDTIFIVSKLVAEAANREDLYIVDDTVRDENGRIIGCRALARI